MKQDKLLEYQLKLKKYKQKLMIEKKYRHKFK